MSTNMFAINKIDQDVTGEYIATVFAKHKIAQISSIILVPYFLGKTIYIRAYVEIWKWFDSEAACNFLDRLNQDKEILIVHHSDECWTVELIENGTTLPCPNDYLVKEFPLSFYEICLDVDAAEKRLTNAHRDLIFARDFGDDYDTQVEAEYAYQEALDILRELFCKSECSVSNHYPKVVFHASQKAY